MDAKNSKDTIDSSDRKLSRSDLLFLAKVAEQCERYDHMVSYIERVVEMGEPLDSEERSLFSASAKSLISPYRQSNRHGEGIDMNMSCHESSILFEYRKTLQDSVESVANRIIRLIDNYLLPKVVDDASLRVYYMKMRGDYFRYIAESVIGKCGNALTRARDCYKEAYEIAEEHLDYLHPGRLGLVLNWSVFQYEVEHSTESAIDLASSTVTKAASMLKTVDRETFRDSMMIVELLRDNLQLWDGGQDSNTTDTDKCDDAAQMKIADKYEGSVSRDNEAEGKWPEVKVNIMT